MWEIKGHMTPNTIEPLKIESTVPWEAAHALGTMGGLERVFNPSKDQHSAVSFLYPTSL